MKKSELKNIIKEEIKNTLNEISPSPFIKNKFPNVIKYEIGKMQSKVNWILISTKQMDKNKIAEFQASVGYAPQGYGGPFDIKKSNAPDGTFKYEWSSFSSSD